MAKIHLFDNSPEKLMPDAVFNRYHADGYRGSKCGYMRKNVVKEPEAGKVTCFFCLRVVKQQPTG